MEQDMDRPIEPPRRSRRPLYIGLGAGAAIASLAAALIVVRSSDIAPPAEQAAAESAMPEQATAETATPEPSRESRIKPPAPEPPTPSPIPKRLADAFEAATGFRKPYTIIKDGYETRIRPLGIIELPFGPALLTETDATWSCHACAGAIGVYYLEEEAGKVDVTGRWPRAVEGWTWGSPPTDWELTSRFTAYPAIYATGGFLAQGISTSGATITELGPDGPATSDHINTHYDDEGSRWEGEPVCTVRSRIANIRKDRSFDVVVSGSIKAVDRYVKRNGRFVARKRISWDPPCGFSHDR